MGRKPQNSENTKLKLMMNQRNLSRKQLVDIINKKFPNNRISPDAVSRICNGQRKDYSLSTLLRFCAGLNCTPNDLVNYEHLIQLPKRVLK